MSIVRKNPLNTSNFANFGNPKVNKLFEDVPKTNAAGTPVEEVKSEISFEKPAQTITFDVADPATETHEAPESTPEERRDQRRQQFKSAADVERRAINMQKQAEEQLKQLNQFKTFMEQAKKDPTVMARALNMDPTEFLRQYQNAMFAIPNDPKQEGPKLSPEEEVKARLERYDAERKAEREQFAEMRSNSIRQDYIQNKILPVILSNPSQYEILNLNGRDTCAGFIYDMMNAHYLQTGQELNPQDVADEMENQLSKEYEEKILMTKKLNKFKDHFRDDTSAPGQELSVPGQLGESDSPIQTRTSAIDNQAVAVPVGSGINTNNDVVLSQGPTTRRPIQAAPSPAYSLGADAMANSYGRQQNYANKRESRLSRMEAAAKAVKIVGIDK